jgi:hypothetical protein
MALRRKSRCWTDVRAGGSSSTSPATCIAPCAPQFWQKFLIQPHAVSAVLGTFEFDACDGPKMSWRNVVKYADNRPVHAGPWAMWLPSGISGKFVSMKRNSRRVVGRIRSTQVERLGP